MKHRKILALMLAIVSICAFALSGCKPEPPSTARVEMTGLGFVRTTDTVKSPSNDVSIEVFSEGRVVARDVNELTYSKAFLKNETYGGDIIRLTSDYQYMKVEMLDFPESIIYSPTGEYVFQVPATGTPNWQEAYPSGVFTRSSNTIKASVPTAAEIVAERNLAANPYDFLYTNELNVTTGTDLAPENSLPESSISVEAGEVLAYPHAYANRFTTGNNRGSFLARNAIDGDLRTGKAHIGNGYQSWGGGRAPTTNTNPGPTGPEWTAANNYGYYDDLTFVLYFGRSVTLTELGFVMRADDSGTVRHDIHFSGMTVEFSDGSEQELSGFVFSEDEQKVPLNAPKTTTSVRLKNFVRAFDTNLTAEQAKTSGNWTALTEMTAYGTDSNANAPAVKTTVENTFGGKELAYKTNVFSASELKDIIDFASVDSQEVVKIKNSSQKPENWWRDGVLFSALTDAYTTAGSLDAYLFTQYASDRYQYTMQHHENGRGARTKDINDVVIGGFPAGTTRSAAQATDFADNYLVGESYLVMNDLRPVMSGVNNHKLFNTYANFDGHLVDVPSWDPQFNKGNGYHNSNNTGPTKSDIRPLPDDILDWWWCDAIYMGLNSFTFMSNTTGDPAYIEKAFKSYEYWKGILCCTEDNVENHRYHTHEGDTGLWHRDMDFRNYHTLATNAQALGNPTNFAESNLPAFWARGNAWVFAALAKQMLYIDKTQYPEIYDTYKADFIKISETLKNNQREDGAWNPGIIAHDYRSGREATGTSGFIYGIATGVQLGILPAAEYMPVVEKGFQALLDMRVPNEITVNGLTGRRLGYMQDVGYDAGGYVGEEGEYTSGSAPAKNATNAFGYGLFIHAASAVMRMCSDYTPAKLDVPADAQFGVAKVPEYFGVKQ